MRKKPWTPFESKVYRHLRERQVQSRTLLLAVSGGADSTAMLRALVALKGALKLDLHVAHLHHGRSSRRDEASQIRNRFRAESRSFVQNLAKTYDLPFRTTERVGDQPEDEQALREFRRQVLGGWRRSLERGASQGVLVATAHHQQDLLESRLLRLVRGTGLSGLESMAFQKHDHLRPLLLVTRPEIEEYLQQIGQIYQKDPGQQDLRSFLRQIWLPLLDKRLPNASANMARSLELILNEASPEEDSELLGAVQSWLLHLEIERGPFSRWSVTKQKQALRHFLHGLGLRNYTQGHILEILRHLDKDQKKHSFTVCGLDWTTDGEFIRASKRSL